MIEMLTSYFLPVLNILAALFVLALGILVLVLVVMYLIDVSQTTQAVRHNYPVIGRFRYFFEHMGVFFRQYFFALDREEMPFNRAERSWVYRAAKGVDSTVPFGSTRDLTPAGTILFVNCPFPDLDHGVAEQETLLIGPYCDKPFQARSFFNISGMSFGAISRPAVLALSNGARMAGCWMNTGEGGLSPYHLQGGADLVFQIGTAKYGVRNAHGELDDTQLQRVAINENVRMFEIKLSQGAKPGKGGILPGAKVTREIAMIRGIPVGVDSLSPNRHTDVRSVDDLLTLIARVRRVTGKPTGIKLVLGAYDWLDELCQAIHARGIESAPDFITLDSADGGTGAAPMSLIDYVGLPIRESLPVLVDKLRAHGLRERIRVIASGKLINPAEVAWALCMGADFINNARGFMFALGCIQALQCNKNTCPTGITTHNEKLQQGLDPRQKDIRVKNYHNAIVHEVAVIAHSCGAATPRELRRRHARIVMGNGRSVSLDEIYPE